jgi:S1-C subfamily serine protease
MDYEMAQEMHVSVTYGWRVRELMSDGPSQGAGVLVNDIIVGINGTRIRDGDEMSSYLEENTLPKETVILNVVRGSQSLDLSVILAKRPQPPA